VTQFTTSLWGDEAFSAVLSMKSIPQIIQIVARDTSPPLYNITEHLWFQIFGTSEMAIRSLSFLYYLLAIFFVYKIGAALWNKKTGFVAAVLAFLNPFFFIYAFEGRMYSILALGVIASMYFFIKRNWPLYVMATTWAIYSHHFAIFALLVQSLWFLYKFAKGERKLAVSMFKSFITVGVFYLPWVIPLYNQTRLVGSGFWLATPTFTDLRSLIYKYLALGINHKLAELALYLVFASLIVRRWTKAKEKTVFLALWFLIPIITSWLISQKFQSIFFDRYLLYTIPAAMLVLASNKKDKISKFILLAIILVFAIIDFNYFTHPTKRPFRELAAYVKETRKKEDVLINWNSAAHHLWESKYYKIPAPIYVPEGKLPFYVGTAQMTDKDTLRQIPEKARRVGVITSGPLEEIALPGYTEDAIKTFGSLKFIWFKKK
jgi:uncharacterized membrane protein